MRFLLLRPEKIVLSDSEDNADDYDPGARRLFAEEWGISPDSLHLKAALTHSSAAPNVTESGERLEFLGDALLSAYVARYLISHLPVTVGEDTLSRARVQVVRKETLAVAGRELGISRMIAIGPGERKEGRHKNDSLLADAYEALLAVICLECGDSALSVFIDATLGFALSAVVQNPPEPDPKTLLQMKLQATGHGLPVYETVEATGRGHEHNFVVVVRDAETTELGHGEGPNKRAAQMQAAKMALLHLNGSQTRLNENSP